MNIDDVENAVAQWLPWWRYLIVPRVEMDLAALSRVCLLYEIEIKLSMADWMADFKKRKWRWIAAWGECNYPASRFSFAVPAELVAEGIPTFVPEWTGILAVRRSMCYGESSFVVTELRKPKRLHDNRISERTVIDLAHKATHRYWRGKK